MSIKYVPTGNEYISLPELNQETGEIHSISFLSMKRKGMLLITGLEDQPFIKPFITGDASNLTFTDYSLEKYWIPTLNGSFENGVFNKRSLRNIVFNDKQQLNKLENLIHPFLKQKVIIFIHKYILKCV